MKKSVVISCAGMGTRLGFELPKCLVKIEGKTIIERQLEQLKEVDDIIIVIGYKAELVKKFILSINKNVKFVYNNNYEHTSTGASFSMGAKEAKNDFIIALDGDLLVHPSDIKNILENIDEEFIGGVIPNTDDPVYMTVSQNNVINFNRNFGEYEWSGLAGIKKDNIKDDKWYVYNILEEILPTRLIPIRAREIDTLNDFNEAIRWIKNDYDNDMIVDDFFKKRFTIDDNYVVSRYRHNDRAEYDSDFIKQYINPESIVLDLGCGTGILEEQLYKYVKKIIAVDKYQEFLDKAIKSENIEYLVDNFENLDFQEKFDLILLFGVTMYLTDEQLNNLLKKMSILLKKDGVAIIKNQWGVDSELIVNKYSDDLESMYYAKYRKLSDIINQIKNLGFKCETHDIYPENMNDWKNTHEYALVLRKR